MIVFALLYKASFPRKTKPFPDRTKPLPKEIKSISGSFDIHVTVHPSQLYRFKLFCAEHKIEPTYVLSLDGNDPLINHQQLMTSEHTLVMSAEQAVQKALDLSLELRRCRIDVLRVKVEARAESQGVAEFLKTSLFQQNPEEYYFEFHWKLENTDETLTGAKRLHDICKRYSLSCATNLFGKHIKSLYHPFVAYRLRTSSIQNALQACDNLISTLKTKEKLNVLTHNVHKEFVVFDTNPEFDRGFVPSPVVL